MKIFSLDEGGERKEIPKIIWFYWHDPELPLLVDLCIKKTKELHSDYDVRVLSDKNLNYYIDLNWYEGLYHTPQLKSDIIRLNLIKKYGGIWLDASVMTFKKMDFVEDIFKNNNIGFLGFCNLKRTTNFKYPIIESWFIAAEKENLFIEEWLTELNKALKLGVSNYVDIVRKCNPDFLQKIDDYEYLIIYICGQLALRQNIFHYALIACDDTVFQYHFQCSWRYLFFGIKSFHYTNLIRAMAIYKKPKDDLPVIIKLVSGDRYHLEKVIAKGLYKKDTLLDVFLEK